MRKIRPSGMNIERREKRISPLKNKERPKSHNSFTEKIEMMVKRKKKTYFFQYHYTYVKSRTDIKKCAKCRPLFFCLLGFTKNYETRNPT